MYVKTEAIWQKNSGVKGLIPSEYSEVDPDHIHNYILVATQGLLLTLAAFGTGLVQHLCMLSCKI